MRVVDWCIVIFPEKVLDCLLQEISEELELEFDKKERELLQRLAGEDGMVIGRNIG